MLHEQKEASAGIPAEAFIYPPYAPHTPSSAVTIYSKQILLLIIAGIYPIVCTFAAGIIHKKIIRFGSAQESLYKFVFSWKHFDDLQGDLVVVQSCGRKSTNYPLCKTEKIK